MGRYVFSKKAEEDLIDIYRYGFLNHSERQANQYSDSLKEKCQFLADTPLVFRERDEFTPPVRIHTHKRHLIIYKINEDHILIIRILHERMNVEDQLASS
ncbi:type II toxin-antitoxin system RelE/ParE family toxin [Methylicorpusculum oleiharenae]|uniref:type II toxin-antitoxin system RelE/ParE family toxin n=1 Tax=Methylicorpusculum oleiharenae TaxID=1338687 RepID=UPI00135A1F6F|nr:type II toxin-antitoxin system RelE/ParE family toxin [Methylicorpusculum oleiharenae]MCD2448889.1 type II toxin-antitoxin system RelE/ParE family toxin [Methylicorpusculum oleiharenae]